jgi:hypothetical protein
MVMRPEAHDNGWHRAVGVPKKNLLQEAAYPIVNTTEPFVVVEIGAEGGGIKVLSRSSDDGCLEYSVTMRDQTLTFLAEDEGGAVIRRSTDWMGSWNDAVAVLDRWPWPMLHPLRIHPEFRYRVLVAVEGYRDRCGRAATGSAVSRWRKAAVLTPLS